MATERLQLVLTPDQELKTQPLAPQAHSQSIELIARMLLAAVRASRPDGHSEEACDESR